MIRALAPLAAVTLLTGGAHSLWRAALGASRARKYAATRRRLRPEQIEALVRAHGSSANSFMTLYPDFEFFAHPDPAVEGAIAFVETPGAWVGAAEPFCPAQNRAALLDAFAEAASSLYKTPMLLPVGEQQALAAANSGYRAVMIGTEPTWDLERFPRTGKTWNDVVPTAKTLASRGARVTAFAAAELVPAERSELEELTRQWLDSRKMERLAFLNQVDPWFRSEDKRYFRIEFQGRVLAFLAAIPVWAGQGWYLIDLIRRQDSPAGSTELLLLQAMKLLRDQGARFCTMGVAPLSGLENAPGIAAAGYPKRRLVYRILWRIYDRGNAFYNFKPLHQYKLKFDPSATPPVFLIYRPRLGARAALGLARAFQPSGMARAAGSGALRMISRFSLTDWIRAQLDSSTVVRSVPPSWVRLLERCKLTVALLACNVLVYLVTTDPSGHIIPSIESAWGFSWPSLLSRPLGVLIPPAFLHWSASHLCLNLLMLAAFTGGLEYLAGSGITAACYFIPMLGTNPLTAAILATLKPWVSSINLTDIDVGASLGIFGTAGALSRFLSWGPWLVAGLAASAVISAFGIHSSLALNHLIALALGWGVAKASLK